MPRRRRWLVKVRNVTLIAIEGAIERQRPSIESYDPERYTKERGTQVLSPDGGIETHGEQVTDRGMRGDNRPFRGSGMK
jgi:hypothetical protein